MKTKIAVAVVVVVVVVGCCCFCCRRCIQRGASVNISNSISLERGRYGEALGSSKHVGRVGHQAHWQDPGVKGWSGSAVDAGKAVRRGVGGEGGMRRRRSHQPTNQVGTKKGERKRSKFSGETEREGARANNNRALYYCM